MTLIRRNLSSSVKCRVTGEVALWVSGQNVPFMRGRSLWIPDFTFKLDRSKAKQIINSRSKRTCYWVDCPNYRLRSEGDSFINTFLENSTKVSLPNPKVYSSVGEIQDRLELIEVLYDELVLHSDGRVYGI